MLKCFLTHTRVALDLNDGQAQTHKPCHLGRRQAPLQANYSMLHGITLSLQQLVQAKMSKGSPLLRFLSHFSSPFPSMSLATLRTSGEEGVSVTRDLQTQVPGALQTFAT